MAAAIALFGPLGIIWVGCVFAFWLFYSFEVQGRAVEKARADNQRKYHPAPNQTPAQHDGESGFTKVELLVVIAIIVILFGFLMPMVGRSHYGRHAAKRIINLNKIRMISLAMLNYESAHGHLPPAYLADENGKPMHSWRVLILPFMEGNDVYEKYDFDEPWDGPNNSQLASEFDFYSDSSLGISSNNQLLTSVKVITGPRTAFVEDQETDFKNIASGWSKTILFLDDTSRPIHWMSPEDISIDKAIDLFDPKKFTTDYRWDETKFSRTTYDFRAIALMDGSIHSGGSVEDPDAMREFMTVDEMPSMELDEIDFDWNGPVSTPKAEGYILLAINIALALMPGLWIGKKRKPNVEN